MAISPAPNNVASLILSNAAEVYHNLSVPTLYEHAVNAARGQAPPGRHLRRLLSGERTGRSPKDKFVVKTPDISEARLVGAPQPAA